MSVPKERAERHVIIAAGTVALSLRHDALGLGGCPHTSRRRRERKEREREKERERTSSFSARPPRGPHDRESVGHLKRGGDARSGAP